MPKYLTMKRMMTSKLMTLRMRTAMLAKKPTTIRRSQKMRRGIALTTIKSREGILLINLRFPR